MNENVICPIYFEDHRFAGHMNSIENFTNIKFGDVRTTIINSKPYFCAIDICRGLCINVDKTAHNVFEATADIINSENMDPNLRSRYPLLPYELYYYIDLEVNSSNQYGSEFKRIIKTIFVSEPVLYMLMFKSRKREAIAFKSWLAVHILPNMRLLGFDKSVQLVSNEANNIADQLKDLNTKYDLIKNITNSNTVMNGKILNKQDEDMIIINNVMIDIANKINSLGITIESIYGNQINTNNKITNIASGLNMVFGK